MECVAQAKEGSVRAATAAIRFVLSTRSVAYNRKGIHRSLHNVADDDR